VSQRADLEIVVQGLAALMAAVAEAGAEIRAARRLTSSDGTVHPVDYVVTDRDGAEVGVKLSGKARQATFLPADCEAGRGRRLAGRVAQAYARSRVLAELERKGYRVAREVRQRDGSLRLVLQRWR